MTDYVVAKAKRNTAPEKIFGTLGTTEKNLSVNYFELLIVIKTEHLMFLR